VHGDGVGNFALALLDVELSLLGDLERDVLFGGGALELIGN